MSLACWAEFTCLVCASVCAALHHACEPLGERAWVRGKLAIQDLGLIQQQVRSILPEHLLVLAKVRQGEDQLVLRIELQDRLRGRAQLPGSGQDALQLTIE